MSDKKCNCLSCQASLPQFCNDNEQISDDGIICPHCEETHLHDDDMDCDDFNAGESVDECCHCGGKIRVYLELSYTWTVNKVR